ncbi:MAG: helix-turn-helix domain-containing protein, partial [Nitrospinota bacterium]
YHWPGNVRELENVLERTLFLNEGEEITPESLPERFREKQPAALEPRVELDEDGIDLKAAVEAYEDHLILQALERTGWVKNKAARLLRLNRTTLVEKLKKKGLMKR